MMIHCILSMPYDAQEQIDDLMTAEHHRHHHHGGWGGKYCLISLIFPLVISMIG